MREDDIYSFNKDFDQWRVSRALAYTYSKLTELVSLNLNGKRPKLTEKVSQNLPNKEETTYRKGKSAMPKLASPKERLKKVLNKDIYIIPDWVDNATWDAFLEMRKEKQAIPTKHAKDLLIKELEKLKLAGHNPTDVLNRSIRNSWKDVFPLQGGQSGTNKGHSGTKLPDRNSYAEPPPDPELAADVEAYKRSMGITEG